ncbi:MAG: class I SAM-dependent methyltransferase [Caldilineae bacterium]|nr:MAG: class I SAM-dependent methyltransferase [Caldilineae bacterium]
MDELARFNRDRWNRLVEAGVLYSRPKLDLDEAGAREMVDEAGLLGDVTGQRVLLLGGGGGQQSAAFGILGAQVTVLDLSDRQLEQDRLAADHYGYPITLHQGDMRDLSRFADDSFDLVWQPYSINFVPEVRPVFAEVARVLVRGGLYRVQWANPFTQTLNDGHYDPERGYSMNTPYEDGELDPMAIWGTDAWDVEQPDGSVRKVSGPREFRHTMSTFINTLIDCGFILRRILEHRTWEENPEPGSWEHYKRIAPPYLAVWSVRA